MSIELNDDIHGDDNHELNNSHNMDKTREEGVIETFDTDRNYTGTVGKKQNIKLIMNLDGKSDNTTIQIFLSRMEKDVSFSVEL